MSIRSKSALVATLLALPLLLFFLLLAVPRWDPLLEAPFFHFYIVSFASCIALVAALFIASAMDTAADARTLFLTLAFSAIAALFLLHGLATPGVLIPGFNQAVGWSTRLSLAVGAVFFGAAATRWGAGVQDWLAVHRRTVWLAGGGAYGLYIVVVFGFPAPLERLSRMQPWINYSLAAVAAGLMLWAAGRAWRDYRRQGRQLEGRLAAALALLAEAQVSMVLGSLWQLSWWLYHPMMLAGFALAVFAIVAEFEAVRDFRPARYFAALGSIAALGLALLAGEAATRWLGSEVGRWPVVGLTLIAAGLLFLILYAIVLRADRLITERTAALRREQHLRAELTRLIIHDLKNPLSVIIGGVGMVAGGFSGPLTKEQIRSLGDVERAGENMRRLIDDLLDVERLEAAALKLKVALLDPAACNRSPPSFQCSALERTFETLCVGLRGDAERLGMRYHAPAW